MRTGIIGYVLFTLLLCVMIFGRVSHAAISTDVKYVMSQLALSFSYVRTLDYDKVNDIIYFVTVADVAGKYTTAGGVTPGSASYTPFSIAVNSTSSYFSSTDNGIYRWNGSALSSTDPILIIPLSGASGADNIPAISSATAGPKYLRLSPNNGDLYFTEDCRVRKISNGIVYAVAGSTCTGTVPNGDGGLAINAQFATAPGYITLTPEDELLVLGGSTVRKVFKNGTITSIISVGSATVRGLAAGSNGDVYTIEDLLVKKYRDGVASTIVGSLTSTTLLSNGFSSTDPLSYKLSFTGSSDIVVGLNNTLYFVASSRLLKLTPYCSSGYAISSDFSVCYPICNGIVTTSPLVCSNSNGTCIANDTCQCNSGYTGSNCEIPICYGLLSNDTSNVCSGRGSCVSKDKCVCQQNYSGLACNVTTCSSISSTNPSVCSGRGSCTAYNTCKCSQSYYVGTDCENTYCFSISSTDSSVCSGHGSCSDYNKCSCSSKWYGSYCNITECFSVLSNSSSVCSGAGTCNLPNNCTCNGGYNGTNCENFDCFGVSVNSGQSACKNNGTCSGPGACSCLPTYYGKTCEIATCFGILSNNSNVCSTHGTCSMLDTCICNDNYYGKNCSFPICYGITYDNSSVCSSRGKCTGGNKCECNTGYAGNNCELNVCYGVNSDQGSVCSSRGSCGAPDSCQCNSGYRGPNCQYVEMVMDAKTAVLSTAVSNVVASYAPTTATSCSSIFSAKDLSYLGNSETTRCIWNQNTFKIYLGYRHFVYDNMTMNIVGNAMNFTLQVVLTNATQTSTNAATISILPQLSKIPKTDVILKSFSPSAFQAFRNTSLTWSNSGSDISSLLSSMNNKPVVVIPSTSITGTGVKFSLTTTSTNWIGVSATSSKVDIDYATAVPYFELVSETSGNQFYCSGFDCIIEVNPYVSPNPTVSFDSTFSGLNSATGDFVIRFLNRVGDTILNSYYDGSMQIQASTSALTYAMSYTSFEEVPIVLQNTEKQFYGNKLTITASYIDPMIEYLGSSSLVWFCSFSTSKTGPFVAYSCSSNTKSLIIGESNLSEEGYHKFEFTGALTNSKISSIYKSGIVQNVKSNIADILFDIVPPVYPSSRNLVLNAVISSSTQINNVVWQVTKGNLLNVNVLNQATTLSLDGYNIKSTLVIDKSYLLQGDSYTFTLTATNGVGGSTASVSTVVDVAPRITCQAYDSANSVIYAYSSDVVIDCTALSDYSIASYHVDIYTNSTRVMTVSKSMKKTFMTKVPYGPDGNVQLVVRAVNKIGSVSSTSIDLKVSLKNTDNSLSGRIGFANSEFDSKKATFVRLESVVTMHSLLLLIIQQNSVSEFAGIDSTSKSTLTGMLTSMLTILNDLKGISSNADDKIAPVFIPFANDAYRLLAVVSSTTVASNTNLLTWVNFFIASFNNYKAYYRATVIPTIYDSKHLTEIDSLIGIGAKYISDSSFSPLYKDTAAISKLINDVTNSSTSTSTIVDSSGTETRIDIVDILSQLNSKTVTFTNYPTISFAFPADFYKQIGSGYGSGITLTSSVSTKYSQLVSPSIEISLSSSTGSAIAVSGLSGNLIQINYGSLSQPKANFTNSNYTCRYLNTTSSQWSQSGVSSLVSILSDDGTTVTFSLTCLTSHLTAFGVVATAIPPTPTQSKAVTTDNTGVIVGAVLGTILPLLLIAAIVVVVVIIVIILYKRKKSQETSRVQNVELVNKNVSSVYISDFPSEESTHFKQLVSVSSGSTNSDPLSRYADMVKIGQGAFGSVFKGVDTKQAGKLKAIKVIRFNSVGELNNMLKEGTMLMNIDHPHILKVNEFIIDKDNILCIDTDFCEEGDLTKLTLSPEPVPEPIIKQVIYQMCSALAFIHNKLKIIHRDVKPHNIFLRELTDFSVQTVLADFGLAKQDQNNSMNSYAGTPLYMSPELALGGKYNYNTDTWSLGVVAYQLMTKDITSALSHLCLTGDSEDTKKRIRAKLDEAGQYSEALKEIVLSMLEKDAASRPYPQELVDRPFFQDYRPKKKKNNIFRSSSAGEDDMYM